MTVDSEYGHKQVNLVQYRRLDGRWQFVPVTRKNGKTFLLADFVRKAIATLTWPDIHYKAGNISLSSKPQWEFTPKSCEVRTVEVPSALLAKLTARQMRSNTLS